MLKSTIQYIALPEENVEELSAFEKYFRRAFDKLHRFTLACFFSYRIFNFFFSPIFIHGFTWCLNIPVDLYHMNGPQMVRHQDEIMSYAERYAVCSAQVVALYIVLWRLGFADRPQRVSRLVSLATAFAFVTLFVRTQQAKHLLFPGIHEAAYTFVLTFVVGVTCCVRWKKQGAFGPEAMAKEEDREKEEKMDESKTSDGDYEIVKDAKSGNAHE